MPRNIHSCSSGCLVVVALVVVAGGGAGGGEGGRERLGCKWSST